MSDWCIHKNSTKMLPCILSLFRPRAGSGLGANSTRESLCPCPLPSLFFNFYLFISFLSQFPQTHNIFSFSTCSSSSGTDTNQELSLSLLEEDSEIRIEF